MADEQKQIAKLNRKLPVRVSLTIVNIALFVFCVCAIGIWKIDPEPIVKGFMGVSGVIGTLILGDSYRPSGTVK